jgi:hypothetical protein
MARIPRQRTDSSGGKGFGVWNGPGASSSGNAGGRYGGGGGGSKNGCLGIILIAFGVAVVLVAATRSFI